MKSIKGYEGLYSITEDGKVWSHKRNIYLKSYIGSTGYLGVTLCKNGKLKPKRIHRLVAKAYIPNSENKKEVNHGDGNKLNNHRNNLGWMTPKENMKHAIENGLTNRGKRHGNIKLTEKQVIDIREKYSKGNVFQYELANEYNVSQTHVGNIIRYKRWEWLK